MKTTPKCFYVYIITNKLNNKQYVGSKIGYFGEPLTDGYFGSSEYLDKDISIHGKENFIKEVLQSDYETYKELLEGETFYILQYNTLAPNGYNRFLPNKRIGFNTTNTSIYELWKIKYGEKEANKKYLEWKEKESLAQRGEKNKFYGKKHTEKTKEQNRQKHLGKNHTKEAIEKIKKTMKENGSTVGDKNGMHHRMWINNGINDKVILKIELNTYLNDGWKKGRIKKS